MALQAHLGASNTTAQDANTGIGWQQARSCVTPYGLAGWRIRLPLKAARTAWLCIGRMHKVARSVRTAA
jgi:hypothetical protein